ncbi:MAG: phospho-sugar mutase [Candidatus Sumerlaeales bacterium]|nr:phospho-sugar mutase [Candidatus Sumerlaeales bacterium]
MLSKAALDNLTAYVAGSDDAGARETLKFILDTFKQPDGESLVEDAFYRDLEFGTGGLRGIMGPGTNRMNTQVVAKATQGLLNYIQKTVGASGSVVIAHDCRNNSEAFAQVAACVVAGNGMIAYLFDGMRPTPELSFAVRHLGCSAGIVVTASHNPKEYNGYKVSWSDGAQVVAPHDTGIIDEVRSVKGLSDVKMADYEEALSHGGIKILDGSVDEAFLAAVDSRRIRRELTESRGGELKIVYTPLHGTGITMVPKALARAGFANVICEPRQSIPDGNFPTTKSPNPEERVALELAIALAEKESADLVIATDPDADRVGTAVRHAGKMELITGNQMGALLVWYLCNSLKLADKLPKRPAIVTTIVTSRLGERIALSYGVDVKLCLTGFKWIAGVMRTFEQNKQTDGEPELNVLMGYEESYGYLFGTSVRDKDSVSTSCLIAEMALWCKSQNMTLIDLLNRIYTQYGVHMEKTVSVVMPGKSGMEKITALMAALRSNPPRQLAGIDVIKIDDISNNTTTDVASGAVSAGPGLPTSNVLGFYLADGSLVYARPSGTEPKVKFYMMVVDREGLPFKGEDLPMRKTNCEMKRDALTRDFEKFAEND